MADAPVGDPAAVQLTITPQPAATDAASTTGTAPATTDTKLAEGQPVEQPAQSHPKPDEPAVVNPSPPQPEIKIEPVTTPSQPLVRTETQPGTTTGPESPSGHQSRPSLWFG